MRREIPAIHDFFDTPDKMIIDPYPQGESGINLLSGLMVWWDLASDIQDKSGNGRHLSFNGTQSHGSFGGRNALSLSNGNHAYISAGTAPELNLMTVFTWAGWIYDVTSNAGGIMNNAFAWSSQKRFILTPTGTTRVLKMSMHDGSSYDSSSGTTEIEVAAWNHFIVTFVDGDSAKLYMNNVLEIDWDISAINTQTSGNFGIGIGGDGDGGGTSAECDFEGARFAIWDRIITADERAALYNGGADLLYADL